MSRWPTRSTAWSFRPGPATRPGSRARLRSPGPSSPTAARSSGSAWAIRSWRCRPIGRPRRSTAGVTLASGDPVAASAAHGKPESVLILGSGPVVIGQAAEFDYAGTQACRALRAEGVRTILVNSNPATIMTDPAVADAIYLEPLTVAAVEAVIARERPDGILAGLGGQTALNRSEEPRVGK